MEIADLAKQIEAGDHLPSLARMRTACEAENWEFLLSCSLEHLRLSPQSPRPYAYMAMADAHLGNTGEMSGALPLGSRNCPSVSDYIKEYALVYGVMGSHEFALLCYALYTAISSGRGSDKTKLHKFISRFRQFTKENNILPDKQDRPNPSCQSPA